jgi:hypothetical protein
MPGYWDYGLGYARCPECDGPDIGNVGFFMHRPTCPTQPDYEEAQRLEDEARAERRREIDELVASPETARLRALRTARRLGSDAGS